jgi:hypothetical protein
MANKFWVVKANSTGFWNSPTNWSTSLNGANGAPIPGASDVAVFDAFSGSGAATLNQNFTIAGLNCTGFTGTLAIPSPLQLRIEAPNLGNVILSAAATYSGTGSFFVGFSTITATVTFTTNNALLNYPNVYILGKGQSTSVITLVGALTCKILNTSTCTLAINGNTVTCDLLQPYGNTTFAYGDSGTSQIVIPSGGGTNSVVVNQTALSCLSSGTQRPFIRLTYSGGSGSRVITNRSDVFDYVISGADVVKADFWCKNLDLSGFSGTLTPTGETRISENLTFKTDTKWTSTTNLLNFTGTGTQNIDTKGTALLSPVTFSGTGGTYVLTNTMSMGSLTDITTLTSGTLNLNGKTLTVGNFSSSNTNVRGITFASGKIISGGTTSAWIATTGTNLTITGPGSIELTNPTAATRIFAGGNVAYNGVTLIISGAATGNTTSIQGSNSFYSMINTISPQTIWFAPNSVTIFTDDFQLNGTAGKNINITSQTAFSTLANAPKFAKPSGDVVCSYANIIWNTAAYTGSPATSTFTSKWAIGVGSVLTPNQTSGWTKSAGTAGFITFFYP